MVAPILRERVREKIAEATKSAFDETSACVRFATELEQCAFEWATETDEGTDTSTVRFSLYEYKSKQLIHALFVNGVFLCKTYDPRTLVCVDDACLASVPGASNDRRAHPATMTLQQALDECSDDEELGEAERQALESNATFTCRKCHSTDVMFNQKQTSGGDEAMTVFCTCKACGNKWKS